MDKFWSRFILKLKKAHPFFATVALFSSFRFDDSVEIAKTQGREVSISPAFFSSISENEQFSYLLHQILHLVLLHPSRGVGRNETIWNIAADIVINHIIAKSTPWPRPPKTAWDNRFPDHSVEYVYAALIKQVAEQSSTCLLQAMPQSGGQESASSGQNQAENPDAQDKAYSELTKFYDSHADVYTSRSETFSREEHEDTRYWRQTMRKANQLHPHVKIRGDVPLGSIREFKIVSKGQLDWRHLLWRYATDKRNDYSEFDHRHIYRGIYTEFLLNYGIRVAVGIDTSGSVSQEILGVFIKEMLAISACHPETELILYYIDAEISGPYQFHKAVKEIPPPVGGGGTSFVPFFNQLKKEEAENAVFDVIIYFTDGYGKFPTNALNVPVLWVVPEDGEDEEKFPFGQVIYIGYKYE